jgi:hypothetical protein
MGDSLQVENLVTNTDMSSELKHMFTSLERAWCPDINQGDYSSGYVQFDGATLRDAFINYADAELWIPLTITNSTLANFTGPISGSRYANQSVTGTDILRWKGSVSYW